MLRGPAAPRLALAAILASLLGAAEPARSAREISFTIALTGDTIVTRPLSGHSEADYVNLIALLRSADAAFTNLETLFHDFEGPAMPSKPSLRSDPKLARDLVWAGFDLVARANNHAGDYGIAGLRATTRHVVKAGLVQAGAGESLSEARRASVLRTAAGRLALLSATTTFSDAARAGDPRGRIPARPGIHALRVRTTYRVREPDLEVLRRVARELGLSPPAEGAFDFGGMFVTSGPETGVSAEIDASDLSATLAEVRRVGSAADYTMVSIHCHEQAAGAREAPPPFLVALARAAVEAGADVVVGHGPHTLRGVEIYQGRPIFYSLGNFLFQYETVSELPAEDYESLALSATAKPDDFFDRYDQGGTRGYPADPEVWESAVAVTRWKGRRLEALELHPISLGFGLPRHERGRPRLAGPELGRKILERLARLSEPLGTKIELADGVGRVVLARGSGLTSCQLGFAR